MNTGSLSGIFDEYNSKHKVYHNKHLESSHWGTLSSEICRLRLYEERGQLLNQTNKAVNSTPLIPHKSYVGEVGSIFTFSSRFAKKRVQKHPQKS